MTKMIGIYSIFLAAALALAYQASKPRSQADANQVEWVRISPERMIEVSLESPTVSVTATPIAGTKEKTFWIDYLERQTNEAHSSESSEESQEEVSSQVVDHFRASDRFNDFLNMFNPLYALRVIGQGASANLEEYGLGENDVAALTITTPEGEALRLGVGKRAFGSRNYFAHDYRRDRVILIDGQHIEAFERARNRLFERDVARLDIDDITHAEIFAQGQTKRLERRTSPDGSPGWAVDKEGSELRDTYGSWMNGLMRLRVVSYPDEARQAELSAVNPFLTLTFLRGSEKVEEFQIKKLRGDDGQTHYYLTTVHLGALAQLNASAAENIERDLPNVLATP